MPVNAINLGVETNKYPVQLANNRCGSFGKKTTTEMTKMNILKENRKSIRLILAFLVSFVSLFIMIKTKQFAKFNIKKRP